MLTKDELQKLTERIVIGKAAIESMGGWGGGRTPPFDYTKHKAVTDWQIYIRHWFTLSNEFFKEAAKARAIANVPVYHSEIWYIVKRSDAYIKWKATVKAKRGPDPRTLPKESFA